LVDLFNRVMGGQAKAETELMRYFMVREPVWGAEWFEGVRSIIPYDRKSTSFGMEIYSMINRGDQSGSMGLTIWGSYWYNWGTAGALAWACATGAAMQGLNVALIRGPKTTTRVLCLFAAGYRLTIAHDPFTILLQGAPTILALYAVMHYFERTKTRPSDGRVGALAKSN
jgi:hypothetical protein